MNQPPPPKARDPRAAALLRPLARPAVFIPLVVGYFILAAALIDRVMPNGHSDDAEVMLLSQSFEWGYEPKNPPLFTWGAWLVAAALAPSAEAIFVQRMLWLAMMVVATYLVARRVQPDPLLAAAAGAAPLATLHLHWYALFDFTHTNAAGAFYPLTVLAVLALHRRRTLPRYLLLGLVVGLGLLTKYVYALFLVALVGAVLANARLRPLVLDWRVVAAAVLAAVIDLPHAAWLAAHLDTVSGQARESLALARGANYWPGVAAGLAALAESVVSILAFPLGVLYLAFLRGGVAPAGSMAGDRRAYLRLLRDLFIGLALVLLTVVAAGATHIRPHHLFFLCLAPVWLIGRLDAGRVRAWGPPAFLYGVVAWVILVVVAFIPANLKDAGKCVDCEEFLPMADFAAGLRDAGFSRGTIVTLSRRQRLPGAMLREYFPDARIVSPYYPTYVPPALPEPGACLLVWSSLDDERIGEPLRRGGKVPGLGVRLPPATAFGTIEGRLLLAARPAPALSYALVSGGLAACR